MLNDVIAAFTLIVALLGLILLWRNRRRRFLAALLACLLIVGGFYVWRNYHQERQNERAYEREVAAKEEQVIDLLCENDANYEEIYAKTSQGFSDKTLNDAIDDLMQAKQSVTIKMTEVPFPDSKRQVLVRLFHLKTRDSCHAHSNLR